MKRLISYILFFLVCFVVNAQNKNSELIRTLFKEGGYKIEDIGMLYIAGCHPEYLYVYDDVYVYKERTFVSNGNLVSGKFGVRYGGVYTYKEHSVKSKYNSIFVDLGLDLWQLYKYEGKPATKERMKEIKRLQSMIKSYVSSVRDIYNKSYVQEYTYVDKLI